MFINTPKPSRELIDAALAVLTARAAVETIKPIVEKIQSDIVTNNKFVFVDPFAHRAPDPKEAAKPQRLTDFDSVYLLNEGDQQRIYALLEDKYNKAGFANGRPHGHCPLLIAQSLEIKAANMLIEVAQNFHPTFNVGDLANVSADKRAQYIEIVLRFVGATTDLNKEAANFTQKAA